MEQLSLLQKIYQYGETLSSEELNQIVQYLNSSIEAINTLIARNNNINEGHCEMRYKVSAQQPEAPESGTDGKSNGWSDTYTRPDTANGEITWMTLSFFNGEGVYGAWSTPVCITWGSVRGQAGPKGESGLKGSFKSRVFKRQNSRPDTPTGGTYDNPIPSEGGWTDGIPSGAAIIWSSVCTFYGNGLSSGWSIPAPESDSDTLDIEFSPYAIQPEPPTGNTPFSNHESEGWYDPNSDQFNLVGTMIWRAERKVSNGEYNGEWTITRIVGEKGARGDSGLTGGHYEFRYNNFKPSEQASAPTKPSNGSNGTTGGWTTFQETLTETQIKEGYATWMTQCYQNENNTYGAWTDPIRITGANGYDGADGNEIEFVYTRNNTGVTPAAPPTTQQNDWTGTVNGVTWTDNPQGVLEDMMYEYVSQRAKINDVWSDYSTPVIWSKWGEKGMDGDGFEYIYKRFQAVQNWASITGDNNPANWKTNHPTEFQNTREYLGPTNETKWSDDPQGIDETYKYEYVSVRQEIDGVWHDYSTPTLWSGLPGVFLSRVFTRTNDDISNVTPSGGTYTNPIPNNTVIGSGQNQKTYVWSDSIPNGEAIIWSSTCIFNGDGSNNGWSKPQKESDTANLDIEFTDANSANGSTAPTAPYGNTPFSNHSSENPAWYDPSNIPANKTMVWRAERKVANGVYDGDWVISRIKGEKGDTGDTGGNYEFRYANFKPTSQALTPTKPTAGTSGTTSLWAVSQETLTEAQIKDGYKTWMTYCFKTSTGTYGTWSDPVRITGANGLDGEDGYDGDDGSSVEFIYHRDSSAVAPSAPTAKHSSNSREIADDDWYGLDSNGVEWTDNPSGVTSSEKYEYVAVREKPAGKNQSWGAYHVALWSKWGEKGMDGDGYEYIYKHFSSEQTWGANDNNPNNWAANQNREYYGPTNYTWSDDPTGVDSTNKYEYVSVRQRVDGTWQKFSTPVLWSNYAEAGATVEGPQGKLGPMSYLAGIWNATTTYTKTETANPIVYYTPNDSYYYLIGNTLPVSSTGENPSTTTSKWAQAENYNMVFTDILFVNTFAKLGSFIVNRDWMLCHYGTIYDYNSGVHPIQNNTDSLSTDASHTYTYQNAYLLFDPAYPDKSKPNNWNFVPNYAINAVTGEIFCNNAHITGNVNANSGTFNGTVNASGGVFNGIVNATQFKAGDDNGFSITTSPDSLDFNYNGSRLAFFSLRGWDETNNQLADVADNPTGFYLYLTNPLNGHLITINFNDLSFKDLNENQVVRHEATFYSLVNQYRKCQETQKILYYSIEEGVTKWWEHSDSSTELTSAQMGTLYKRMNGVARTNGSYHICVQEVSSQLRSYQTTNFILYEEYTLQNNVPTKTGNYAMVTHLNTDGTSSTNYYFVEPGNTTTLTDSNTNWNAVQKLDSNSTINSTTAITVVQTSNTSTVPTFTSAVSLISYIDENGNVSSILYPPPTL